MVIVVSTIGDGDPSNTTTKLDEMYEMVTKSLIVDQ